MAWGSFPPLFVFSPQVFGRFQKAAATCDSPLEGGVGVCPLRQAFTLLHGGEHTPATALSSARLLERGSKIIFRTPMVKNTNKPKKITYFRNLH